MPEQRCAGLEGERSIWAPAAAPGFTTPYPGPSGDTCPPSPRTPHDIPLAWRDKRGINPQERAVFELPWGCLRAHRTPAPCPPPGCCWAGTSSPLVASGAAQLTEVSRQTHGKLKAKLECFPKHYPSHPPSQHLLVCFSIPLFFPSFLSSPSFPGRSARPGYAVRRTLPCCRSRQPWAGADEGRGQSLATSTRPSSPSLLQAAALGGGTLIPHASVTPTRHFTARR